MSRIRVIKIGREEPKTLSNPKVGKVVSKIGRHRQGPQDTEIYENVRTCELLGQQLRGWDAGLEE